VIWGSERPEQGGPPVLVLRQALDSPLGELSLWLGSKAAQTWPETRRSAL